MKKEIIVLGSAGMAGHVISLFFENLNEEYKVISVARSANYIKPTILLDVSDFSALERLLEDVRPDFIINCIGLLNQNAENHPDRSILINSYLPHFLEAITKNTKCKVIHISTDCVFSGDKGSYHESDFTDGRGFYAQSKALGEIKNPKDLTIRTSIIGPELNENGIGLFHWFSRQEGQVKGYTNAYWSGVTTLQLAKSIHHLIDQQVSGLFHLTNSEKISKYDLIMLFKEVFSSSSITDIVPFDDYKVDKSLVNTRKDVNIIVPGYSEMIWAMKEWIGSNNNLYSHYRKIIA
jgi:dTDP-4-dehydrorhamnose reductase